MRKTRLVILPTKCLHSVGFLLLFLSCPVIGDWGRIRPESENSHNAIQIEREGTCGIERDPPGGLLFFLNKDRSKQCLLSENSDLISRKFPEGITYTRRLDERQVDVRRIAQRKNLQMSENVRRVIRRNIGEESVRRDIRSRSVLPQRSTNRNDVRRSLSLSRLGNERSVGRFASRVFSQQSVPQRNLRQFNEVRRKSERLHLARQMYKREAGPKVDQQRNERKLPNERRENERAVRDRRVRNTRFARVVETERRDVRREKLVLEQSRRIENDMTRRQARESARERSDNRLFLARREVDARRVEISDNRRSTDRMTSEKRLAEIQKARSMKSLERKENSVKMNRNSDSRRFVILSPKLVERNFIDRQVNERLKGKKSRRFATVHQTLSEGLSEWNLEKGKEKLFGEIGKLTNLKSYESYKGGDWTTNCVIGALAYFLTTRQVKSI